MAAAYPSYAATSSTSPPLTQRPSQNVRRNTKGEAVRTKILLVGLRRVGKTSIQQVLFNNLPPKQTFYLETTMRIVKHAFDTVIPLEIWDCPGNVTVETLGVPLAQFSSLIFVIDIRDLYNEPISRLIEFMHTALKQQTGTRFEVFVHKAEKLSDDDKLEYFRQIHERVTDRLLDISPDHQQLQLNFHLTSVFDHSLHLGFSRVLQRLIDSLPFLEDLLNVFCANSQSPKAFLFDTRSCLYIATDVSPVDAATHNLCCDYLAMLNSFGPLYKSSTGPPARLSKAAPSDVVGSPSSELSATTSSSKSPTPMIKNETINKDAFYPSAATSLHPSTPGTTVTYHLITPHLALLAILPTSVYEGRRGLLEYNVVFFRQGVQEICDVETEVRGG